MVSSDEPDWAVLLRQLYEDEQFRIRVAEEGHNLVHESDDIHEEIPFGKNRIDEAIQSLLDVGLLEKESEQYYQLTQYGFEVAHERAMDQRQAYRNQSQAKRQLKINRAGVYVSIGILLIGLFRFITFAYDMLGVSDFGILSSVIVGTGMVIAIIRVIAKEELLFEEGSLDTSDRISEEEPGSSRPKFLQYLKESPEQNKYEEKSNKEGKNLEKE